MTESFDLVVIGAGPGGMSAALAAGAADLSVALVTDGQLLGYGLGGAYKSKALWELAMKRLIARDEGFGYVPSGAEVRFSEIQGQLDSGVDELIVTYEEYLARENVTAIAGRGVLTDAHSVAVGDRLLEATNIIIATGSRPRMLPGLEADGVKIVTSDEIVHSRRGVDSLLVVGAGVIGCEFASIFAALGTQVTLLDRSDRLMGHEDPDLSTYITDAFRKRGIDVRAGARAQSFDVTDAGIHTELEDGTVFDTSQVLFSIGRVPLTQDLGLERAGVDVDRRGIIPVDPHLRTNVPNIYAIGDVGQRNTPLDMALVHVAQLEGRLAVADILGRESSCHPEHVPYIVFSIPMIAGAGLSETIARERYGAIRMSVFRNDRNHRYHAMRRPEGFLKLIVGPEGDDRILGVRAVGEQVDSIIGEVAVMIDNHVPYTYLLDSIHAHPSLGESLQNAARVIAGQLPDE